MRVTVEVIEASKMIIEQLEYFFIINFDRLLLKVLYIGLLWELLHGVCMWECTRQEDQINSNELVAYEC